MHKRKSSKDNVEQENVVLSPETTPSKNESESHRTMNGNTDVQVSPLKARENMAFSMENGGNSPPRNGHAAPSSAGPYRTSFGSLGTHNQTSPLRKNYTHARTMSSSGTSTFSSPMLSPPSSNFPRPIRVPGTHPPKLQASHSESAAYSSPPPLQPTSPTTSRRHQRIHSRNLSVFFPRPGSISASTIAEDGDGSQEIELPSVSLNDKEAPVTLIPSGPSVRLHNPPGPRRLGEGFTFGSRPERTISSSSAGSNSDDANGASAGSAPSQAKKRGHHHKHSLSHNFFSFLEPGSNLSPVSPSPEHKWHPISPFPSSAASSVATFTQAQVHSENGTVVGLTSPNVDLLRDGRSGLPKDTIAVASVQFLLGASLWVSGQQHGSLACTGLGYWIVFDSFGVALRHVLPSYLSLKSMQSKVRRSYGNARIETLLLFAQTIYLIFSSVYVCKEAVEHLLLSVGDGHHHHPGDESSSHEGLQIPKLLTLLTMVSLVSTCMFYENHSKLLSTTGQKLPSFSRLFRPSRSYSHHLLSGGTPLHVILANPFTVAPLFLSAMLLVTAMILPPSQQGPFDLLLALFEAVLTFKIAYPAAVVQGAVLLQTAPPRNTPGARMESILRVMREIERHPLVLHLPAPHMWQLTPSTVAAVGASASTLSAKPLAASSTGAGDVLVIALELHVRRDTDDGELLTLTRWAYERCRLALGLRRECRADDEDGAEITIGVVKG